MKKHTNGICQKCRPEPFIPFIKTEKLAKNTKVRLSGLKFPSAGKKAIRDFILGLAGKSPKNVYLDFYGSGESYRKAKRMGIKNIIAIDDGRNHNKKSDLQKIMLKKELIFTSLRKLCTTLKYLLDRKFNIMWLDYCGEYTPEIAVDIGLLPTIMQKKGKIFFTFVQFREKTWMSKAAGRPFFNFCIKEHIKLMFEQAGIKATLFYEESYLGGAEHDGRKKKGTVPMIVYGYNWTKIK